MCVGILESYFYFTKNLGPLPPYPIHARTKSKLINIYLLNTYHVLTSMVLNPGCLLTKEFPDIIYFLMVNSDATCLMPWPLGVKEYKRSIKYCSCVGEFIHSHNRVTCNSMFVHSFVTLLQYYQSL